MRAVDFSREFFPRVPTGRRFVGGVVRESTDGLASQFELLNQCTNQSINQSKYINQSQHNFGGLIPFSTGDNAPPPFFLYFV